MTKPVKARLRAVAQLVTTQTDIAFLMAAASHGTSGVRQMLAEPPR